MIVRLKSGMQLGQTQAVFYINVNLLMQMPDKELRTLSMCTTGKSYLDLA